MRRFEFDKTTDNDMQDQDGVHQDRMKVISNIGVSYEHMKKPKTTKKRTK